MPKHICENRFQADGARGGCYFNIRNADSDMEGMAYLDVGHSCVIVHDGEIPISWISELIAIATLHKDGIAGFLNEHGLAGDPSYALMCDPPKNSL